MMRTSMYYMFLVYSSLLLFLGLLLENPVPIFVAVPFIFIILFSEMFRFRYVQVKREYTEQRYVEGDVFKIKYELKGYGYFTILDELQEVRGFVHNYEVIVREMKLKDFGRVRFREMVTVSEDIGGMQVYRKITKLKGEMKIYPKIEYVRRFRITPHRTRTLLGDYPSHRKGLGMEFTDIREYRPGDPVRWVNWKASARKDKIMVNEFESERTGDAVILLDARRFYKGREEYEKLLKHSVQAVATLVTYMSRTKNRVGFVMLGETVDWIYPSYGRRARYLILERLLTIKSEKISRVPFEYAKFIVSRFFPPNSFVILISPLLSWDIDNAILELMAKSYDILVISPTLIGEKADFASRILRSEREVRLRRLRLYANVVDWDVEYPLTKVLMVMR